MNAEITEEQRAHAEAIGKRKWGTLQPIPKPEPLPEIVNPNLDWYIVHVVGKSDDHAVEWLTDRGLETYYPQVRELRPVPTRELSKKQRASGVRVNRPRLVAFMPRYLFVRFDMTAAGWREIFDFAGIGGMVCEGDLPVRAPSAVASLREREIDGAIPGRTPAKLIFSLGQQVVIKEGAFAQFPAIVEKLPDVPIEDIDADTRIRVAVSIFGRSTPVDLEVAQIQRV